MQRQTLTSFELICIDDGSTDDSPNILREYAAHDGRIVVLRQEHAGAGVARNLALNAARGEYVAFLDADDALDADYLLKMTGVARAAEADTVVGRLSNWRGGAAVSADRGSLRSELLPRDLSVFCWRDLPQFIFNLSSGAPVGKLFRRDFLEARQLHFPALPRAEDIAFIYGALAEAERIAVHDAPGYRHRINNPNSLEHTKDESPLAFWEATALWKQRLTASKLWPAVKQSFINSTLNRCAYNLQTVATLRSVFKILRELKPQTSELLELDRHDRSYFYNPSNLDYVTQLLQYEDENEYLFARCRRLDDLELQFRNVNARCAAFEKALLVAQESPHLRTMEKDLASVRSQLQKESSMRQVIERELKTACSQLQMKEKVTRDLQHSVSFRLGRILTWAPRKVRDGLRCWREHGGYFHGK